MSILQQIAPVVTDPWTVYGVAAALGFWAAMSGSLLWRGTGALARALRSARAVLEATPHAAAFAERYESLSKSLSATPILGSRWREWQESLIIPSNAGRPVRSTSRPESWFNLGLLPNDARYHAALPNLLVGAGLLFTFLGLAVALDSAGDIAAEGVKQSARNEALQSLLSAASFKFITSLAGLFFSIAYALFRKWRLRVAERELAAFLDALEQRVPLVMPAALQQEANEILTRQSTQLDVFSNQLAVNLGEVFDRAFDKRLGEHVAPLTEAMQTLADKLSTQNEGALQTMMEAFLQRLQGGAGDRMQEAAAALAGIGEQLSGLQTGLGDAATRMSQSADAMAARMGEGAEAALGRITDQLGGLAETLRSVAEQTRQAGDEAGRDMASRMEAAAITFESASRGVAESLALAAEGMERRMGEEATASSSRLAAQFESMLGELQSLAESSRAAGASTMDLVADRIASAAAGFEAVAGRIAETLDQAADKTGGAFERGAEEAVSHIAAATESMRSEMGAAFAALGAGLGSAGSAFHEQAEASATTLGSAVGGAGHGFVAAMEDAARELRSAADAAGGALQRGGEAAGGRLDQAGTTLGTQAGALGRQVSGFATATDTLAARAREIGEAAREAAIPLNATAATLRSSSDGLRTAVQSFQAVSTDVSRAADQIGGAAQRAEAANVAAAKLLESLDAAVARFDQVDKALARTVDGLQKGLVGFTQEVSKFVVETDKNLAKAATQLGNLVKSLEDTLEDHAPPEGRGNGRPRPDARP